MPALDDVVHKHIDILRVAEQDHYNQLKKLLQVAVESRVDDVENMEELKKSLMSMRSLSDDIAKSITRHTLQQLSEVTKAFEGQIITLKSHAESVKMSLHEGDSTLSGIRNQSEIIMKQMVLSSNKMKELKEQNDGLYDLFSIVKTLVADVEAMKSDYAKAKLSLSAIADELKVAENEQLKTMNKQIESLSETLSAKIDKSLEELHEHYHIAGDDITQSVQILAKKAKLKNGYADLDS